jgi:hypothetical protein
MMRALDAYLKASSNGAPATRVTALRRQLGRLIEARDA